MAAATANPPAADVVAKAKTEPTSVPPPSLDTYAEVGDAVEWFPAGDPNQEAWCGVVCQLLLPGQVTVSTLSPHWKETLPQSPCFHISDRELRKEGNQEGGGWRHKPQTIALRRMLLDMGYLRWEKHKLVPADPTAKS